MDALSFLLAQLNPSSPLPTPQPAPKEPILSPEITLILAACGGVALLLFLWASVFRRRRPQDPHLRPLQPGTVLGSGDPGHHRHSGRRRHRRRHHRELKRNPTLQETGGLPPPRPDDQLPAA